MSSTGVSSHPFTVGSLRLVNPSGSKVLWVGLDNDGNVIQTAVNDFDSTYVPKLQSTPFDFSVASPSVSTNLVSDVSYTNVRLQFDASLGASSTVASLSGATISNVSVTGEYLQFSYSRSGLTDTLEVTAYASGGTISGKQRVAVTLIFEENTPTGFVSAPTTQSNQYTALQVSFVRAVTSVGTVSSLSGGTVSNISVVGGKVQFDYLTPAASADTIRFADINDGAFTNTGAVDLAVSSLLIGPAFTNLTTAPTSQSYQYNGLVANFSKAISTITVTASAGTVTGVTGTGTSAITFNWLTPAVTNPTLTFNNLTAVDGSIDAGTIESTSVTLATPPATPSWFSGGQPKDSSTAYTTLQVSFSESVIAPVPGIATVGASNSISNVSIVSGRVQFDVTTDAASQASAVYRFTDVYGSSGGIAAQLDLGLGPYITGYQVNGIAGVGDKALIGTSVTGVLTFSKALAGAPTVNVNGTGATVANVTLATSTTVSFTLTAASDTTLLSIPLVTGVDSTTASNITQTVTAVSSQTFTRVAEASAPTISKTTYDQNTAYNLLAVFGKNISATMAGVTVTASTGSNPTSLAYSAADRYSFDWTPDTTGSVTLNFNNTRDSDSFVYTLFSSPTLTVNSVSDPLITTYGAVLMFDASEASSLTLSGSDVTEWRSVQPVDAVTMLVAGGANSPNTTTQNGKTAISFVGATGANNYDGLLSSSEEFYNCGTLVAVYNNTSTDNFSTPFYGYNASTQYPVMHGGTGTTLFIEQGGTGISNGDVRLNKTPLAVVSNGNPRSLVNGMTVQSHSFGTRGVQQFALKTLGWQFHNGGGSAMNGTFCQLVVFPTVLSAGDLSSVEDLLIAKWGITL